MPPLRPLLHDPSLRRPAIVLAALVAAVVVGERVLTEALGGGGEGASHFPAWLPELGTVGETVLFYVTLFDVLKFVAIPAALAWLAYAYGRHSASEPAD